MSKTAAARGQGSVLSTYLAPPDAAAVRARARAADRTVAAEIRRAVRAYLSTEDERRPGKSGAVTDSAGQGRHDEA